MMVMVHGDITGKLTTGSGKKINPKIIQFIFNDPATNAVIYCSYLMATSVKYMKE